MQLSLAKVAFLGFAYFGAFRGETRVPPLAHIPCVNSWLLYVLLLLVGGHLLSEAAGVQCALMPASRLSALTVWNSAPVPCLQFADSLRGIQAASALDGRPVPACSSLSRLLVASCLLPPLFSFGWRCP